MTCIDIMWWGPGWLNELGRWIKQLRQAAASDNVYQLLAHGRWFSPGAPTSSTTKISRHDIAAILLKVALNTKIKIDNVVIHLCKSY